jgi:hypothetical protein
MSRENMGNIGERYKDKLTEDADWRDGINAFRDETTKRMLDLFRQINELELIIEELANTTKSRSEEG